MLSPTDAANNIKLYYNSFEDLVQIRNSSEVEKVMIYSITGQQFINLSSYNEESMKINVNMLQKGIYIANMQLSNNCAYSVKFVK